MHRGIHVPNFGPYGSAAVVAQLAAAAEGSGWDALFLWDHVVRREGDFAVVDPWIALTAAALATERILLGPLVTPLPRRRPWNVAKSAVGLDDLSHGRMVLGVGTGTPRGPELPAFGEETDARRRGDMLDEGLTIVRTAWTGEPVTLDGTHYRLDHVRFLPTPRRPGGIPIWGATESVHGRAVRRAATLDGVVPIAITPDDLPAILDTVGRERIEAGTYDVVTISRDEDAAEWEKAGATWWLRELPWQWSLDDALERIGQGPAT